MQYSCNTHAILMQKASACDPYSNPVTSTGSHPIRILTQASGIQPGLVYGLDDASRILE